jgi:hypothetical protein
MVAAKNFLSTLATLRAGAVLGVLIDVLLARDFIRGRWHSLAVQTVVIIFAGLALMERNVVCGAVAVAALVADEDVAIIAVVDLAGVAVRPDATTEAKFFS